MGVEVFVFTRDRTSWIDHIGEYHARATKNVISQDHSVVDGYIILNSNVVTKDSFSSNIHILAKYATFPYFCAGHHMRPVPYLGARPNVCGMIDNGGFMYEYIVHSGS